MAYKVKALYLSGRGKKVFKSGDIVEQEQLNAPVLELLKKGFLVEVVDQELYEEKNPELENGLDDLKDLTPPIDPESKSKPQEEKEESKGEEETKNPLLEETKAIKLAEISEVTYEFLINELKTLEVSHKANISKKEAYELWKAAQKQV